MQWSSAGKRQWSGIAEAQQQLRLFASVGEEFALQLLAQGGHFAGLVEIGVGNALLREVQQETLQAAACCHPVGNMVCGAGNQCQMGRCGDFFAVGFVLCFGIEHDNRLAEPAWQIGAPRAA